MAHFIAEVGSGGWLIGAVGAMIGWMNEVEFFGASGVMPATSSALILVPLVFLTNIVVSRAMAGSIENKSIRQANDVLMKMHALK